MTKLGHVGGYFSVTCEFFGRDDLLQDADTRIFYYTAEAGKLSEEEFWGPAKDKAFAFAEAKRKDGWRCRVYHCANHLIDNGKGTPK